MAMTEEPIAIRDMTQAEAREHYRDLRTRLFLVAAQYDGTLNKAGQHLLRRSQLAARVALRRVEEGR